MGKDKKSSSDDVDDKFHGEASTGIPCAEFVRLVTNWYIEQYGSSFGKQLWENTL